MIVTPLKIKTNHYNWMASPSRDSFRAQIPSHGATKSGYRPISMCAGAFQEFFTVPAGATDLQLRFSKRATADGESYKMASKARTNHWGGGTYRQRSLDGFEIPGLMGTGHRSFDAMIRAGYEYVSVSYK